MKKKTMFIIGTLLIGAVLLSACGLMEAQGVSPTSERYIRVSGSGEVAVVPNIAYINIGVHSEAEDVSSALEANNTQATELTEALKAEGIEEKDIQTANFNVYPQTRYDNMGQPVGTSYVVDNTVYVTVRDLANLGKSGYRH